MIVLTIKSQKTTINKKIKLKQAPKKIIQQPEHINLN